MKNLEFKDYALLCLAIFSGITYTKFKKFKKELKLGITVLKLDQENKNANVLIESLSHKEIPGIFTINKIDLITDTKELASNTDRKTNKLIKQNANEPINFKVANETSISEIENSKIAVEYNVFGFKIPVLYDTQITEDVPTSENKIITSKTATNSCCCH
jgi:GTPase Era involved in 16S rRNA processing